MKNIVYCLILLLITSGCSHRIVRTGYSINKSDYKNCNVIIKKFSINIDSLQKVGEIKLGESGLAVACSEGHAIEILKKEACALNADLINIIEENRPDFWSSCYRCKAEFYKFQGQLKNPQDNTYYQTEEIDKRINKDRTRNTFIGIGAAVLGFVVGFYMFR